MDFGDRASMAATDREALLVTLPCSFGWCMGIFLTGLATGRAHDLLKSPNSHVPGMPTARWLLQLAVLLNLVTGALHFGAIVAWMGNNDRSLQGLGAYKITDVLAPVLTGLVATVTQSFMAIRCWRIFHRSTIFAVLATLGIASALSGSVWCTVTSAHYMADFSDEIGIFKSTQMWLWCALITDVGITGCLCYHLFSLRTGFNTATDGVLGALMKLAFETFLAPSIVVAITAIIYICTWEDPLYWNWCDLTLPAIPSLYTISFVSCIEGTARRRIAAGSSAGDSFSTARRSQSQSHTDAMPTFYCFPSMASKVEKGSVAVRAPESEVRAAHLRQSLRPDMFTAPPEWSSRMNGISTKSAQHVSFSEPPDLAMIPDITLESADPTVQNDAKKETV